jgi:hypothetical protein
VLRTAGIESSRLDGRSKFANQSSIARVNIRGNDLHEDSHSIVSQDSRRELGRAIGLTFVSCSQVKQE